MGKKDLYQSDFYEEERAWEGALTLHELLEMDEELRPYVNDHRIHLFDYHKCRDFTRFHTENRLLFELLSARRERDKMEEILNQCEPMDEDSARAIAGMLGRKIDLSRIEERGKDGKKMYKMCKALEDIMEEGVQKGRQEGRREGKEEGRREGRQSDIRNLMESLDIGLEKAMELLKIPVEERKNYSGG